MYENGIETRQEQLFSQFQFSLNEWNRAVGQFRKIVTQKTYDERHDA
jgi:hypothetical protein